MSNQLQHDRVVSPPPRAFSFQWPRERETDRPVNSPQIPPPTVGSGQASRYHQYSPRVQQWKRELL